MLLLFLLVPAAAFIFSGAGQDVPQQGAEARGKSLP